MLARVFDFGVGLLLIYLPASVAYLLPAFLVTIWK